MGLLRIRSTHKGRNKERGQALIEFIPAAVLMLTLILAVIDVSRAIWQMEVLGALSREGSNIASRSTSSTPCQDAATTVVSDGANINLASQGTVIVTQVENVKGKMVIEQQTIITSTGLQGVSRVGTGVGNAANIPAQTPVLPQPNQSLYVTEVFSSYSPITPIGNFVAINLPSSLYDIAYF